MTLRYEGDEHLTLEALADMCQTNRFVFILHSHHRIHDCFSVWTIDLAYLLKKLNARFVFLTRTIGADPDFASMPYYSEQISEDQQRVDALFRQSYSENIPILHQSLHICLLRQICLSSCCLIILLVNHRKLQALRDDFNWILYCVNFDLGFKGALGYEGHYIVVSGYDERSKRFQVHDPVGVCYWVSEFVLDEARLSYGTDEDMIIIYTT